MILCASSCWPVEHPVKLRLTSLHPVGAVSQCTRWSCHSCAVQSLCWSFDCIKLIVHASPCMHDKSGMICCWSTATSVEIYNLLSTNLLSSYPPASSAASLGACPAWTDSRTFRYLNCRSYCGQMSRLTMVPARLPQVIACDVI